jgi:hypothetical protein
MPADLLSDGVKTVKQRLDISAVPKCGPVELGRYAAALSCDNVVRHV